MEDARHLAKLSHGAGEDQAACSEHTHHHAPDDIGDGLERRAATLAAEPEPIEDHYRLHRRFDRMGRLVGDSNMERLLEAHVMVIGLGGVGSFAAEALARSGVGKLSLVDFDTVCITNSNRQLQAMKGTIGRRKSDVLAERLQLINPQAKVVSHTAFYNVQSSDALLADRPHWVVDAIDNVTAKCFLLHTCRTQGIPVVCSTGAAGRIDPTHVAVADLAKTKVDPLASAVRRLLRRDWDFPATKAFGIPAVFSTESVREPVELTYDHGEGFRCVCPGGSHPLHSCERRNVIYGTAGFVTGTFGMTCASVVVRAIVGDETPSE